MLKECVSDAFEIRSKENEPFQTPVTVRMQ